MEKIAFLESVIILALVVQTVPGQQYVPYAPPYDQGQPADGIQCPSRDGPGIEAGEDRVPGLQGLAVNFMIVQSGVGQISCYGVITEWKYWKSDACDDVIFQVWRPTFNTKGPDFTLVGENAYDAGHCQQYPNDYHVTWQVPENQQIPVEPMDVLGFTVVSAPGRMINYNFGVPGPAEYEIHYEFDNTINCGLDPAGVIPGDGCTFTPSTAAGFVVFLSLAATEHACHPPTLDNLPESIWIEENLAAGDKVYEIEASQKNNYQGNTMANPVPIEYFLDPTVTDFSIDRNDGDFRTNIVPDYEGCHREYEIPVTIWAHLHYVTKNITVYINDQNEPHVFDHLPDTKTVSAHTRKQGDVIYRVNTTDEDTINPSKIYYTMTGWTTAPVVANTPYPPFNIDIDTEDDVAVGGVTRRIIQSQKGFENWAVSGSSNEKACNRPA